MSTEKNTVTVETTINAPVEKVWEYWTGAEHIMQWCNASEDWHAPNATNDLRPGGSFSTTMAAKDGSFSFDFGGVYDHVHANEYIAYTMGDGRKVTVHFTKETGQTKVVETFETENQNPIEMQRAGWQAIMDNFKKYTEANSSNSIQAVKAPAKAAPVKKTPTKKSPAKKVAPKAPAAKKAAAKKSSPKKAIVKKAAAKKTVAKKLVKKAAAKKTVKKVATKKKTATKKPVKKVAKKAAPKKAVKKAVKKITKKILKKTTPKKAVKKVAPKKAIKKAAPKKVAKKPIKKAAAKKAPLKKKGRK